MNEPDKKEQDKQETIPYCDQLYFVEEEYDFNQGPIVSIVIDGKHYDPKSVDSG